MPLTYHVLPLPIVVKLKVHTPWWKKLWKLLGLGALVLCANTVGAQDYTIPAVKVQDEGVTLGAPLTFNFTGTGVTCTWLSPVVTCDIPGGGVGGGDSIRVEDGDNAGTYTAATDADFDDSGDINFIINTAVSPDALTASIRAGVVSADELDEAGVEAGLEAVLDLPDLQGVLDVPSGGTGAAPGADDQVLVSDSTSAATWRAVPNCNTENMLTYNTSTNTFGCEADAGGGSGLTFGETMVLVAYGGF